MTRTARSGDLVFIGDVHLERDDAVLDDFLRFLQSLTRDAREVILLGDLFNLWIGQRKLEQPHQRAVASTLAALREAGVVVRYAEGNRDYRIASGYEGWAVDEATSGGLVGRVGDKSLFAIHGDLAAVEDLQYRAWRRLSRSRLVWVGFNLLPAARRIRLAERLELRMRRTNLAHKGAFPERSVRAYAARWLGEGHDAVILGHFHVEKDLEATPPSPPGRILVLPEWKESRRHLRVTVGGEISFVDS